MMRIAIPTIGSKISEHFGRCEKYSLYDIENGKIVYKEQVKSPEHAPNVIPKYLEFQGVDLVITSGIGHKAISLFEELGIQVLTGCYGDVDQIIDDFTKDKLRTGTSTCHHGEDR